jgi:hypothetical protein
MSVSRPFTSLLFAAVILSCWGNSAGAQNSEFCQRLDQIIADRPNQFMSFKTGRFHKQTQEWDGRIKLPSLKHCRVDSEIKNYNCWIPGLRRANAGAAAMRLVERVSTCLGQQPEPKKVEVSRKLTRTKYPWKLPGGAEVEVILRAEKQPPDSSAVFLYVQ